MLNINFFFEAKISYKLRLFSNAYIRLHDNLNL